MLRKLLVTGAMTAAFAGLGLAAPAYAEGWPSPPNENDVNVAEQTGNVIVCGNRGVGDVTTIAAPVAPVTFADREQVDCSIRAFQN